MPNERSRLVRPSKEELSLDTSRLTESIDARLNQPDWFFLGEAESEELGRLLLAACLRHVARLLDELDAVDVAGLTFARRLIARTIFETLTLAVYLQFFPERSYDLVRSAFRSQVGEAIHAVEKLNDEIAADARENNSEHVSPAISTASLLKLLDGLGTSSSKLPTGRMIREIANNDVQGFFRENLRRLHLIWKTASMFAPHTNYWVLRGYFYRETENVLSPTPQFFSGHDTRDMDRFFSMHMSACVAIAALQSDDEPMLAAHEIVEKYQHLVGTTY